MVCYSYYWIPLFPTPVPSLPPVPLTSGGNNFNNFPENHLTKFRAFRDSGRDSVAIDDERVPRRDWRDTRLWRYVAWLIVTRSSAVAKRLRDASCLYSFYTLKWCGYPMVKKIRTCYSFWHDPRTWKNRRFHVPQPTFFCFPWRRPCDYHAICCI